MPRVKLSSSESESDTNSTNEVMKIFASDDELDASFSGFSAQASTSNDRPPTPTGGQIPNDIEVEIQNSSENKRINDHDHSDSRKVNKAKKGKATDNPSKGKAPKRRVSQVTYNRAAKKQAVEKEFLTAETFKSLFSDLTASLINAIKPASGGSFDDGARLVQSEILHDGHCSQAAQPESLFSDQEDNLIDEIEGNFDFAMPKIFEEDEKFSEEVADSIANLIEKSLKNKSDISELSKDKIPANCKSLLPPAVNAEIWQFLQRRSKSADLMWQSVQKILGLGIVPLIRMAEQLRSRSVNISELRTLLSNSISILCNAFFELSIRRRIMLKPVIDKRYHLLCNKNEPVGKNLFGDEISKRLRDINEAQKINKSVVSKNFQFMRGSQFRRQPQRGNYRGSARMQPYPFNPRGQFPKNCRQQANFQQRKF